MSDWNTLATQNAGLLRDAGDITINAQIHNPALTEAQQAFVNHLQQTTTCQTEPSTDDAALLAAYRELISSAEKVVAEAHKREP